MQKVNYSTSLILGSEKHQLIYGSKLYGTNFNVFGRFDIVYEENNTCKIKNVQLKIFNFKGILDIGIYGTPTIEIKEISINENLTKVIYITLELQAMSSKNAKYSVTADVKCKDIIIDDSLNLMVNRKLVPLAGNLTDTPLVNGIFDDEFFKRDGTQFLERTNPEIPEENYDNNLFPLYNNSIVEYTSPGTGRCHTSLLNIEII